MSIDLSASRVRKILDYDPHTGLFTWRAFDGGRKAGHPAGSPHRVGYIYIHINGRPVAAHRPAWLHVYGEWPDGEIDHVNGQKADNRIANLRCATKSQNSQNERRPRVHNKSGYLGASLHRTGKWVASIKVDRKATYLGLFPTPQEAHAAYVAAKRQLHPFGTL